MQRKLHFITLFILVFFVAACNKKHNDFTINGKIKNMNKGNIYIYSFDNSIEGFDTLKVNNGEFSHKIRCENMSIISLVFPNYSEFPIFLEPGEDVSIKADAANLKELEVNGTETNELMTAFRKQIANALPPEILKLAEQTIKNYPQSSVAEYLLRRYFIQITAPNYNKCTQLLNLLIKEQPNNLRLQKLKNSIKTLQKSDKKQTIPKFQILDIHKNQINSETISKGKWAICVWASWNTNSLRLLRTLKNKIAQGDTSINMLTINLDASVKECLEWMRIENISAQTICEEKQFDSQILKTLGLEYVPEVIIINNGIITKHFYNAEEIAL